MGLEARLRHGCADRGAPREPSRPGARLHDRRRDRPRGLPAGHVVGVALWGALDVELIAIPELDRASGSALAEVAALLVPTSSRDTRWCSASKTRSLSAPSTASTPIRASRSSVPRRGHGRAPPKARPARSPRRAPLDLVPPQKRDHKRSENTAPIGRWSDGCHAQGSPIRSAISCARRPSDSGSQTPSSVTLSPVV
ncbi:MAG: hypothetical protein ACI8S6_004417 [Myxococcota bacterium]|jgi:hypothetical protein